MKRVLSFTAYTAASAALWWFYPVHMTVFNTWVEELPEEVERDRK